MREKPNSKHTLHPCNTFPSAASTTKDFPRRTQKGLSGGVTIEGAGKEAGLNTPKDHFYIAVHFNMELGQGQFRKEQQSDVLQYGKLEREVQNAERKI